MERSKKKICFLISLIFVVNTLLGCNTGGGTIVLSSFKEYENYERFRFICYFPPPQANVGSGEYANNETFHTDEQYKNVYDCGFNYAMGNREKTVQDQIENLQGYGKYGIKYIVNESSLIKIVDLLYSESDEYEKDVVSNKNVFKNNYSEYVKYDNFAGVTVYDEPSYQKYQALGKTNQYYKTISTNKEYHINLLCYAGASTLGTDSYQEYIDKAVEETGMTTLCFDSYPLMTDGIKESHLANAAQVAECAKNHHIDWEAFIVTMKHEYYIQPCNYDDIAWQVYAYMAFGAKGILPFVYFSFNTGNNEVALIDGNGQRTQTWYSMQEVISEVKSFEHMYMNSEWTGTMVYEADPDYPNLSLHAISNPLKSHNRIKNFESSKDAIIGTYKDKDNRDAFLVFNVCDPAEDTTNIVNMTFNNASKAIIYKKGRRVVAKLNNGKLTTTLGSGEAYYIIPVE